MQLTKYEKARVIGARALQLALGAPPLITKKEINPVKLAFAEFEEELIPLTVVHKK